MHRFIALMAVAFLPALVPAQNEKTVRIAVAGLVHGHVEDFLFRPAQARKDVEIVGIFEPDTALAGTIAKKYRLPESVLFTDLETMLDRVHPDAVATFTNTFDHTKVVEAAAPRHLPPPARL